MITGATICLCISKQEPVRLKRIITVSLFSRRKTVVGNVSSSKTTVKAVNVAPMNAILPTVSYTIKMTTVMFSDMSSLTTLRDLLPCAKDFKIHD
uniref:Ovule protein n=1 Tax=Panagrellus redivivus TaxID=6233 RepID=A0A7E4ZQZ9_PANRE